MVCVMWWRSVCDASKVAHRVLTEQRSSRRSLLRAVAMEGSLAGEPTAVAVTVPEPDKPASAAPSLPSKGLSVEPARPSWWTPLSARLPGNQIMVAQGVIDSEMS